MLSRRDLIKSLFAFLASTVATTQNQKANNFSPEEDLTQYVNPMIGTGGHGHTYPGATVPFGMVQLSPDNGVNGWDWCSGYHHSSNQIVGFSHTHLSGTGIGDMLDILVMPTLPNDDAKFPTLLSKFSHQNELASAGYYSVLLQEHNIKVELTATARTGFHRYTFSKLSKDNFGTITFNLGHSFNWDSPTETFVSALNNNKTTIEGYRKSTGWAKDQAIYFVAQFSKPFFASSLLNEVLGSNGSIRGQKVRGDFIFQLEPDKPLMVKVGISATSIEAAKKNLETEIPHWDFEKTKNEAKAAWQKELKRVQLKTENRKLKTIFYTALYHALLAPTLFNDVDGSYRGADGKIHKAGFDNYTTFSLWDTFRAAHPLYTILQPERVDAMVQSMMAFYREHGLLPVWSLMGNETNTMIGYHSIPVIVDAIEKGLTKIDEKEAFEAIKKSALQEAGGLRYYKIPEFTTREKLYEKPKRNNLKLIETKEPFELPKNFVAGYAKTISGNTIGYHSSQANVNQAVIARTAKNKNVIEWETATQGTPASLQAMSAKARKADAPNGTFADKEVSLVWLAGIDVDQSGRKFDLFVNGEKWFEFRSPKETTQTSFQIQNPKKGATLNFQATHTDNFGDFFGYMWLTVPTEVLETDSLRLKIVGAEEDDDDWFMTFEHKLENRMTLSNVYELTAENGFAFQFVRADIECIEDIGEAAIEFREKKEETLYRPNFTKFFVNLRAGLNTVFIHFAKVDKDTPFDFRLAIKDRTYHEQVFNLRPVKPFNYIPANFENESVSKTLEYAYDDWCIAQLAKRLNRQDDHKLFSERSQYYKNLFDKETGFMRGRLSDGSWKTPFSPKFSSHRQDEYTEGNAWQYSWFVPHDVEGLIQLMGGRERFIKKLDGLFNESSVIEGTSASPDISGLIGQYAHGNEPSHHIAYLYTLAGTHHKTETIVRQITSTLYNDTPDGLCGNEDCGQMSAWYIFSAFGFYPVNPASGVYVIGTPHFEKVEIDVGGKVFTVIANRLSDANRYVQSVKLNGKVLRAPFIKHSEIMNGGKLVFEMGSKTNE